MGKYDGYVRTKESFKDKCGGVDPVKTRKARLLKAKKKKHKKRK